MGKIKTLIIALFALLLLEGQSLAGSDINEVGAFLVFPIVTTLHGPVCVPGDGDGPQCQDECESDCGSNCQLGCGEDYGCFVACQADCSAECTPDDDGGGAGGDDGGAYGGDDGGFDGGGDGGADGGGDGGGEDGVVCTDSLLTETFITVTNAGAAPVVAHFTYVDGNEQDLVGTYCEECDFSIPLSGNDTEVLILTFDGNSTVIRSEDGPFEISCPFSFGMIVVALENERGDTITENVLLGDLVVVNYAGGSAFSLPAIPFQGLQGNGDRIYRFDDVEYGRLPRIVATDFLAAPAGSGTGSFAALNLFTLDFERHHAPLTDCSVTGFDADENAFSASFQFGCWTLRDLCEISPEFCHPNLGVAGNGDTHGWLQISCQVDRDPQLHNGFDTKGGVHGAILQQRAAGAAVSAGSAQIVSSQVAWASLLRQSVTTGDATTLLLESPSPGLLGNGL